MKIIDISMPIHYDMPVYKNKQEKRPKLIVTRDFKNGTGARETRLEMGLHTGTHMDAPLHMIENGQDSSFFKAEDMVVSCKVIDLTDVSDGITKEDLEKHNIEKKDFILLKTKNSYFEEFREDFIYVKKSGAEYLSGKKIKGVGIDSLGIERDQPDHITHKILLGNGIHILEGLRLKDVEEGEYTLIAAPLNILKVEASPVRALLLKK